MVYTQIKGEKETDEKKAEGESHCLSIHFDAIYSFSVAGRDLFDVFHA